MRITKRSVYSGLAGVGILGGVGGVAAAATGPAAMPVPAAIVQQAQPVPTAGSTTETPADETNADSETETNDGPENEADDGAEAQPSYTSSVQKTPEDEANEATETDASEAAEDASLAVLATVTPDEASAAALASQPGTVHEVELGNEGGNVVYEVEIVDDSGVEYEVIIDAGNASVLATQAG